MTWLYFYRFFYLDHAWSLHQDSWSEAVLESCHLQRVSMRVKQQRATLPGWELAHTMHIIWTEDTDKHYASFATQPVILTFFRAQHLPIRYICQALSKLILPLVLCIGFLALTLSCGSSWGFSFDQPGARAVDLSGLFEWKQPTETEKSIECGQAFPWTANLLLQPVFFFP